MKALQLARVILDAAELHENSYVMGVEMKPGHYAVSIDAAVKAVMERRAEEKEMIQPVTLLLKLAWNDVLDWARELVEANRAEAEGGE